MSSPALWAQPPLDYHTHLLLPEGHHLNFLADSNTRGSSRSQDE
ncbi:MAG: hypothetical protein ACRDQ4_27165 [Pseudonocardiaceae bacterium]